MAWTSLLGESPCLGSLPPARARRPPLPGSLVLRARGFAGRVTAGDEEPVLGSCKAGKPRVRRDLYEGGRPSVCAGGPGKPRTPGRPGAGAHFWNCAGKGGASRGGRLASSGAPCLGGSWQARPPVRELAEGWVSQGLAAPGLAHGVGEQEQTLESSAALCKAGSGRGEVGLPGKVMQEVIQRARPR